MAPRNSQPPAFRINPDILLSLATGPVLLGLLVGRTLAVTVQELGQMSEEFLRGDRLPPLDFPTSDPTAPDVRES